MHCEARGRMGLLTGGVTVLFYAAMSLVNGWFERRGLGVPTEHHPRRRMVEKHLPRMRKDYGRICSMN